MWKVNGRQKNTNSAYFHATNVVSLNPVHGKVYSMQNYVINVASDLGHVGAVLQVILFPPPIKTDHQNIAELLLKVALNTITLTL